MDRDPKSKTAEFMALFRAMESSRAEGIRLFEDPLARNFLGPSLGAVAALARLPVVGGAVPWLIDRRWPGARTSGVARTRLIDDALLDALGGGVRQVVVLGAGYDARAYRLPDTVPVRGSGVRRVRFFEVDRPATLTAKRERLRRALGGTPPRVSFVGVDLGREDLAVALRSAGFDRDARAFFVWEGVTNYLSPEAVDDTLRFVGSCAPGGAIAFTYVHRGVIEDPSGFEGTKALSRTLRRSGEEWTFGFEPAEVPSYLEERGLELAWDVGADEYRARYLGERGRVSGYGFYRAALARVVGPASNRHAGQGRRETAPAGSPANPARRGGAVCP